MSHVRMWSGTNMIFTPPMSRSIDFSLKKVLIVIKLTRSPYALKHKRKVSKKNLLI